MGNTPPSIPSWMGISPDYMKTMMAFMLGDGTRRFVPGGGIVSARVMTIDTVNLSGVNWVTRGAATGGAAAIVNSPLNFKPKGDAALTLNTTGTQPNTSEYTFDPQLTQTVTTGPIINTSSFKPTLTTTSTASSTNSGDSGGGGLDDDSTLYGTITGPGDNTASDKYPSSS